MGAPIAGTRKCRSDDSRRWKEEKLNRSVQLTISGCLGPCDLANVALVITPHGNEWFGGLAGDAVYEALIS